MKTTMTVLLVLVSLIIIACVLISEPKTKGMGSLSGSDTNIFSKAGRNPRQGLLNRIIAISSCAFIILAIIVASIK